MSDINSFLENGFTDEFYTGLERLSRNGYARYSVDDSFEAYYDGIRSKVEDLLSAGVYDASKGPLVRLINAVIRNEATKINSKNSHRLLYDDHEHMAETLCGDPCEQAPSRVDFVDFAATRGIAVDRDRFASSLALGEITPIVFSYLWLLQKGGGYALGV